MRERVGKRENEGESGEKRMRVRMGKRENEGESGEERD